MIIYARIEPCAPLRWGAPTPSAFGSPLPSLLLPVRRRRRRVFRAERLFSRSNAVVDLGRFSNGAWLTSFEGPTAPKFTKPFLNCFQVEI